MTTSINPLLYQVNTRVWLSELSEKLGRRATLDDIPDNELDMFGEKGFEWIWFLSVWQTGSVAQRLSRSNPEWLKEFHDTLPDLTNDDIPGSGFAINNYCVHQKLGGDEALARLRKRLQDRGLKLMLDFVPNHMAPDHEWVELHPEYFINGNEELLAKEPKNFIKIKNTAGEKVFAHGRDPYFPGWPDTLQLNYGNNDLQDAMIKELLKISRQCDGVRCDMAMLVLPDIFEKTWGRPCRPFWGEAIQRVKEDHPGFKLMAEVYWDLEWTLQQVGFDYTYDKRLYDRLKEGQARPVYDHLRADPNYQGKMARFMENHDEPRAAAEFPDQQHKAAAIITYFSMGLRFFHQGQLEGKKKKISPHLGRGPAEIVNKDLQKFYDGILGVLAQPTFRNGDWKLIPDIPAWKGNGSHGNYICFGWETNNKKALVVVNYSTESSQCYIKLPFKNISNSTWILSDLLSKIVYERDGSILEAQGLYLDEAAWSFYVFALEKK
jgi:glycosidase